MAKSPSFQFYAGDFLHGTAEMTALEVGLYIRLLAYQWVNGTLPADEGRLSRLVLMRIEEFNEAWPVVSRKFQARDDGRLFNARLEVERDKQRQFREQQEKSGRAGGLTTQAKRRFSSDPSSEPSSENQASLENKSSEPSSEPSSGIEALHSSSSSSVFTLQSSSSISGLQTSKRKAARQPSSVPPQAAELVERFIFRLRENNPEVRITESQHRRWLDDARLILDRDKRKPAEVRAVIDWCQQDEFWKANVLSIGKLREQFDQLKLKMARSKNGAGLDHETAALRKLKREIEVPHEPQ